MHAHTIARIQSLSILNCPQIELDNQLRGIAAYEPETHKILMNHYCLWEVMLEQFIQHGIAAEDTMYMIVAHEIGHAHEESLKRIHQNEQGLLIKLVSLEKRIFLEDEEPIINQRTLLLQRKACIYFEQYIDFILETEKDAFQKGLNVIGIVKKG